MQEDIRIESIGSNEYRVGKNHIAVLDNDLVYLEAHGEQTPEIARVLDEFHLQLTEKFGKEPNYLINLNDCGKIQMAARKSWKSQTSENNKVKIALFGKHSVAMLITSFVVNTSKISRIRFFYDREKAEKWVRDSG